MVLNQHMQGLPPWSSKYPYITPHPSHPKMLHFPLVAPPSLKFKTFILFSINFNDFNSLRDKKGLTCEWNHPLIFYRLAITKHSTYNGNHILQGNNKDNTEG
jgi:hypothetical protein